MRKLLKWLKDLFGPYISKEEEQRRGTPPEVLKAMNTCIGFERHIVKDEEVIPKAVKLRTAVKTAAGPGAEVLDAGKLRGRQRERGTIRVERKSKGAGRVDHRSTEDISAHNAIIQSALIYNSLNSSSHSGSSSVSSSSSRSCSGSSSDSSSYDSSSYDSGSSSSCD